MLRTPDLFSPGNTWNLIDISIERIQMFEPPEGYWLAYSGGKDSDTILELAKMSGVKYEAHYNLTTVDPPELVRYIKDEHPEVIIDKPKESMWKLIVKQGIPPLQNARYCCRYLKERGGNGRFCILGVRWAESAKRSRRAMVELCNKTSRRLLNPIIDWKEHDVWEFHRERGIPHCRLYDEGYKRIGCIMCPFRNQSDRMADADRWPKYYKAYLRAFERMLINIKEHKKEVSWNSAQEVMDWWVKNEEKKDRINPDQCVLFSQD